ncbi:hypothetical protein NC651_021911 [Populus alba x Populus x berolinensis]|nr:hypothetical protein NC651_021911 [Populus alba x Populus x berolinensis]
MAQYGSIPLCILTLSISVLLCSATGDDRKEYIVYMGSLPEGEYSPSSHHLSLLQEVVKDSSSENVLVRSYKRSFNGFSAKLTSEEAQKLASKKEVVSIFPSTTLQLQTTRSWDFMGFNVTASGKRGTHSDIIVGVIDTGIWPESESFNDDGFGPPPRKWRGACEGGENFTCNNKIIGARHYSFSSARDDLGHGSHTASTAAGSIVKKASFYGLAQGTARGGVPSARISAYKVCGPGSCQSSDILSAFDDAIADGVDIITISIGGNQAQEFDNDVIAIGGFHSMAKGILTLQSAGNDGPVSGSVASVAPWIFTVAASSMDRRIIDKVVLGNGKTLVGNSVNSFSLKGKKFPLVYGKGASRECKHLEASLCYSGCLDRALVKGKIVVCDDVNGRTEAKRAGALGAILPTSFEDISFILPLPGLSLTEDKLNAVKSYLNSTKKPSANILKSEAIKDNAAPEVASFSSRGPNPIISDILKPDASAPGIDILAAFPPVLSPADDPSDKRHVKYSVMSGTSMACPHAAGVAAHVKAAHPDWSASAIKSAIMTTAWPMNVTERSEGEFAFGSGHVNPVAAIHPGLVYETQKSDYIQLFCGLGYSAEKIRQISGDNSSCSKAARNTLPRDLNYPSMAAKVAAEESFTIKFHRTVTNVGNANSTYKAKIFSHSSLKIKVVPGALSFKSLKEKKSFAVTIVGRDLTYNSTLSASLVWSDGSHSVRSPIVVYGRGR